MSGALREIVASFGTEFDGKALEHGDSLVEGMIGKLKKFGPALLEAFAVKEIGEFAFGLAEQAEQLSLNAKAIGISTDALQKWDYAANLSGVGAEAMNTGLTKLERSAVKAGKGGSLAFGKVKVSVDKAGGGFKDADELLGDVSEAIANMKDPTEQVGAAMAAFGRSGARLLPFLKQGRAGIAELKAEVDDLGGGFSESFIEKSEEMIRDSKRLDFALLGLKVNAVGPLIDIMAEFADGASKVVVHLSSWIKNSNVTKTALIALGIGGAAALSPLLLSIAPIVLAFLALEDSVTFFSGGKSMIGDWVDRNFGQGSQKKIQEFADTVGRLGLADLGKLLTGALGILTDDKPLDTKFKELVAFIDGTLRPQLKKDFGAVGEDISLMLELLTGVLGVLNKIIDAMSWIGSHTVNAGGFSPRALLNQNDKDQAGFQHAQETGGRVADKGDFDVSQRSFFDQALAFVTGFKAEDAVSGQHPGRVSGDTLPGQQPAQVNVASAPIPYGPPATPPAQVHNEVNITQHIDASVPEDMRKAAQEGAKAGATEGNNLRTKRALVPTG